METTKITKLNLPRHHHYAKGKADGKGEVSFEYVTGGYNVSIDPSCSPNTKYVVACYLNSSGGKLNSTRGLSSVVNLLTNTTVSSYPYTIEGMSATVRNPVFLVTTSSNASTFSMTILNSTYYTVYKLN